MIHIDGLRNFDGIQGPQQRASLANDGGFHAYLIWPVTLSLVFVVFRPCWAKQRLWEPLDRSIWVSSETEGGDLSSRFEFRASDTDVVIATASCVNPFGSFGSGFVTLFLFRSPVDREMWDKQGETNKGPTRIPHDAASLAKAAAASST